jgi:hypothetical protein
MTALNADFLIGIWKQEALVKCLGGRPHAFSGVLLLSEAFVGSSSL